MALKRPEYGSLKVGSLGDATILTVKEGKFDYADVTGEHMTGDRNGPPMFVGSALGDTNGAVHGFASLGLRRGDA